jgi:hypothetical protein
MSALKKLSPFERYFVRKYQSLKGWKQNFKYTPMECYTGASIVAGALGGGMWGYQMIKDSNGDVVIATLSTIGGFGFYGITWPISGPLTLIRKHLKKQSGGCCEGCRAGRQCYYF